MKKYLLACMLALPLFSHPGFPQSPVGWWKGEGNYQDSISTNHGIAPSVDFVTGVAGQALDFHGGVVQVSRNSSLEPANVTVQAWAKATSPGTYRYIVNKPKSGSGHSFALYTWNFGGPVAAFFCETAAGTAFSGSVPMSSAVWDGNWHQLTGTFDGTEARLYVDGVLQTSGSPSVVPPWTELDYSSAGDLLFGDYTLDAGSLPFNGSVDEIRIFNRALSESEVLDTFTNPSSEFLTNGLISYWPVNGSVDDSVGSNNGTLVRTNPPGFGFGKGRHGRGLGFAATGGHLTITDSSELKPTTLTLQTWVQSAHNGTYDYMLSRYPDYCLYTGAGAGLAFFTSDGALTPAAAGGQVWDGAWHQITGVFDGSSNSLYIDGLLIGSTAQPRTPDYSSGNPFSFAILYPGEPAFLWRGLLDDVKFFDVGLSAADVMNSYRADLGDSLVSWWRGEGNATDSVGGNNGSFAAGSYGDGKFAGKAFNTAGGVIAVPDATSLRLTNLTLQALVRGTSPGTNRYVIIKTLNASAGSFALFTGPGGGLVFYVTTTTGTFNSPALSPSTIWDGQYHGVAGSFDGTRVRLFLDGDEVGSGSPASGQIQYSSGQLFFGDLGPGPTAANFRGVIDEVRLHSMARSGAEIRADVPMGIVLLAQPQNQTVELGSNYNLSVVAQSRIEPISYQWKHNGTNLPGQTVSSLSLTNIQASRLGSYQVEVVGGNSGFTDGVASNLVGQAFSPRGYLINVPNNGSLDLQTFTYQFWARNPGSPGNFLYLMAKSRNETTGAALGVYTGPSGGLEAYAALIQTNFVGEPITNIVKWAGLSAAQAWDTNWHQFTYTWDGQFLVNYMDGQLMASIDTGGASIQYSDGTDFQNGELIIAGIFKNNISFLKFPGDIDEIKIFSRALSSSEVSDSFFFDPYTPLPDLVSWWTAESNDASDSVGMNHGTFLPGVGTQVVLTSDTAWLSLATTDASVAEVGVSGSTFRGTVTGPIGMRYVVERTDSIPNGIWTPVLTNVVPFSFSAPIVQGSGFYRAVKQ